jgi:hypothetical protein
LSIRYIENAKVAIVTHKMGGPSGSNLKDKIHSVITKDIKHTVSIMCRLVALLPIDLQLSRTLLVKSTISQIKNTILTIGIIHKMLYCFVVSAMLIVALRNATNETIYRGVRKRSFIFAYICLSNLIGNCPKIDIKPTARKATPATFILLLIN